MSFETYFSYFDSPLGELCLTGEGAFLTGLYLPQHKGWSGPDAGWREMARPFADVYRQLDEYFAGARQQFDIPIRLVGTSFQQRVWQELGRIPFATTITYSELARRVGRSNASRAVGHANGRNPISLIVPCHRVVGSNGRLTGYAGGLEQKQWLLDWERRAFGERVPSPRPEPRERPDGTAGRESFLGNHSCGSPR